VRITGRDRRAMVVAVGRGVLLPGYTREPLDGHAQNERCSAARGHSLIPWPNRVRDGVYAFDAPILRAPGQHCVPSTTRDPHSDRAA